MQKCCIGVSTKSGQDHPYTIKDLVKRGSQFFGLISVVRDIRRLYYWNLDKRFVWMVFMIGLRINQAASRVIEIILIRLYNTLILFSNNSTDTDALIEDELIYLAKFIVLRKKAFSLKPSIASALLASLVSFYIIQEDGWFDGLCFLPSITIGSYYAVEECRKILVNPFKLFSRCRDENNFIEPYAETMIRRIGGFSQCFLSTVFTWASTEDPILTVLIFLTVFVIKMNLNNLLGKETPHKLFEAEVEDVDLYDSSAQSNIWAKRK